MSLVLRLLAGEMVLAQLSPDAAIPAWVNFAAHPLVSVTHTADELSVVCPVECVPTGVDCEGGWRAFRIEGKQDLSAVGILASVLNPLAEAGISIFTISTYDTDYILIRTARLDQAREVLRRHFQLLE